MKRYFANLFIFFTGYLILNLLTYNFLTKPLLGFDTYFKFDKKESAPKILLADSHGAAIDKKIASGNGIFNASYGGDSYFDSYIKLKSLLDVIRVDTVILSVDDHMLLSYRERFNNLGKSVLLAGNDDYQPFLPFSKAVYYNKTFAKYLPLTDVNNSALLYEYVKSLSIKGVKDLASGRKQPEKKVAKAPAVKKADTADHRWSNFNAEERKRQVMQRYEFQFAKTELSPKLEKCLAEIINICREKKIVLIGIKFPLSPDYLTMMKKQSSRAEALFREQSIPVINLKESFSDRTDLFHDQDHLNRNGAMVFCGLLNERL